MRLITISEFRARYFDPKCAPDEKTVRGWIATGELVGKKVGGIWYVDQEAWELHTGDPLVDGVLRESA